jgi:hypothetical protein
MHGLAHTLVTLVLAILTAGRPRDCRGTDRTALEDLGNDTASPTFADHAACWLRDRVICGPLASSRPSGVKRWKPTG